MYVGFYSFIYTGLVSGEFFCEQNSLVKVFFKYGRIYDL